MKKISAIILLLFFVTCLVSSQNKLSRSLLLEDSDTLYIGIKELHPDMFANYSEREWIKEFDIAKSCLKDSMNLFDFYRVMAPLVAKLGDGHTGLLFPKSEIKKANTLLFPLSITVDKLSKKIYTKEINNDFKNIPIGAEIVGINGEKYDVIVDNLLKYISGEAEFFKIEILNSMFPELYYIAYNNSIFNIRYKFENTLDEIQIKGTCHFPTQSSVVPERSYSVSLGGENPKYAILKLDQCTSDLAPYSSFLDSTFCVLKKEKINNLIIDIRNNGGGDSRAADELFQYISPVPFTQCDRLISKISERVKRSYTFLHDFPIGLKEQVFDTDSLRNNPNRYTGKIYLLTSNYTFSAAADLAWTFKHYNMGVIIGEETGGLGVCFGDSAPLYLTNTKLKCGVSWKKFYNVGATDKDVHGVIPNSIIPSPEALIYAIKLIKTSEAFKE